MPVIENGLPVDVGQLVFVLVLHPPLGGHFLIQRRAGERGVEHELVKDGIVADGVSIASSMFSGVWSSSPMIVEPSTRMPCD